VLTAGPLRTSAAFRWFWVSRVASLTGDGAAAIALLLLASSLRHAGQSVALILLAQSVPRILGPVAGAAADRVAARRLLITMELSSCLVYAVIAALRPQLVLLIPLVAAGATTSTIFAAAGRAVIPRLVATGELMPANAWLGTAFNIQAVGGPLAGGLLAAALGPRGVFAADAVTFGVSAVLLTRLPALPVRDQGVAAPGFFADVAAGLRYAAGHRLVRVLICLLLVGVFFGSMDNVVLVFLARRTLHTGAAGFGLLSAGFGVAMVVTSLWLATSVRRRSATVVLLVGWVVTGLGLLLTGFAPVLAVAVGTQLVAGLGNGLANVGEDTLIQQTVPADRLGRVGGTLTAAAFLGSSAAYPAGGWLVVTFSPRTVLIVAGAGLMAATVAGGWAIRTPRSGPGAHRQRQASGEPGPAPQERERR
jgi:MFS family permease